MLKIMFDYGLTTVNDAGLDPQVIDLIDSLQAKAMKLNVYAMITVNQNMDLYLKKVFIKLIILMFVLFKMYGDALGSWCLHA
jgi:hypothetical protein